MRADLRTEAVLQRRDDAAAVGVVLGVRRREEHNVEREPHLEPSNLDIALFEHVEQTHLDSLRQIGELVDRENTSVRSRDESVVQCEFIAEVSTLGHLDWIDLTNKVSNRRIGCRQLLAVSLVAMDPIDRGGVTLLRNE